MANDTKQDEKKQQPKGTIKPKDKELADKELENVSGGATKKILSKRY